MKSSYFFIIGAQRSGTTFLYHQLNEHPEICMAKPVRPEPKFFLDYKLFEKGRDYYINQFFEGCTEKVRGEKSTSYIEFDEAQKRIKSFFPDAKVIIVMRNPVKRALSNYQFSYKNGFEKRTPEEVFVQKKKNDYNGKMPSVSPFDYLKRGEYIRYLKPVYQHFDSSQIMPVVFENLIADIHYLKEIYRFLGVDNNFEPGSFNQVINASEQKFNVSEEVNQALHQHFMPYNRELEDFLKINLDIWK
jgi:hypothetical protein